MSNAAPAICRWTSLGMGAAMLALVACGAVGTTPSVVATVAATPSVAAATVAETGRAVTPIERPGSAPRTTWKRVPTPEVMHGPFRITVLGAVLFRLSQAKVWPNAQGLLPTASPALLQVIAYIVVAGPPVGRETVGLDPPTLAGADSRGARRSAAYMELAQFDGGSVGVAAFTLPANTGRRTLTLVGDGMLRGGRVPAGVGGPWQLPLIEQVTDRLDGDRFFVPSGTGPILVNGSTVRNGGGSTSLQRVIVERPCVPLEEIYLALGDSGGLPRVVTRAEFQQILFPGGTPTASPVSTQIIRGPTLVPTPLPTATPPCP